MQRCGSLERTDFETVSNFGECGVVVFKELILNSFYFESGVGGLERTDPLNSFYFERAVVVLKELILNSFYFGRVWWS